MVVNRIIFDKPKSIGEVMSKFDTKKVSLVTKPGLYPMVIGIETEYYIPGEILNKRNLLKDKRKMDGLIRGYKAQLVFAWQEYRDKMDRLIGKIKSMRKADIDNASVIDKIAKIPFRYKKQIAEIANKYDLNLALLDAIVLNDSLMVNARYDNKKNLIEINPDYLKQHGQIRIGDSGEWISETAKTFIHEFGHVFYYNSLTEEDRMAWQSYATFLQREQLTGDMSQYIVGEKKRFDGSVMYSPYYTLRDEKFVSVYARFNTREDFAECFLYYKVAPKSLERMNPKKYVFMSAKVGFKIEKLNTEDYSSDEQIFARTKIKAKFQVALDDPKRTRAEKEKIMQELKDTLKAIAVGAYKEAFVFGQTKGAYATGQENIPKVDEEAIEELTDRNDEYVDNLVDEVDEEYDMMLFRMDAFGNVEDAREWETEEDFDANVEGIMDSQEHRLSRFAITGISLSAMAGIAMVAESTFAGGYWHTHADDRACDGCVKLDGQWMSFDEFQEIYGSTECDGNCRCGELFEPAYAPQSVLIEQMAPDRMHKLECMCKGGGGQNAYADNGTPGSTIKETNLNRFEKPFDKVVACDYHGTLIKDNKIVPEMKAKLVDFKTRGFKIIIYTAGFNLKGDVNGIETTLRENNVPFDEVWQRDGKPDADVYIDDKSFNPEHRDIEELVVTPEGEIKKGGHGSGIYERHPKDKEEKTLPDKRKSFAEIDREMEDDKERSRVAYLDRSKGSVVDDADGNKIVNIPKKLVDHMYSEYGDFAQEGAATESQHMFSQVFLSEGKDVKLTPEELGDLKSRLKDDISPYGIIADHISEYREDPSLGAAGPLINYQKLARGFLESIETKEK